MANMYAYNTSTARKLNIDTNSYRQNLQNELRDKTRTTSRTVSKPQSKNKLSSLVSVILAFAMAFVIVNGYVSINEANNEITQLKNEYGNIVAANQALQVKIDKTIDLKQLQTVAGEKFGMVRPERYQMFYVDLQMSDLSEDASASKTLEKEKKLAVMGVPGIITGTLNIFQ